MFCSVSVFEVTALLKKESLIYRKTAIHRAFHVFSEYVFQYVLLFPLSLKCPAALERGSFQNCNQSREKHPPLLFGLIHPLSV